ncbi:alpha/beta-hydrolase family protein [Tsukamurella sp. PLM1]|uniref:alpha/beta hydrolase n=1 Tax=Tsukamurella sp. PLM1 TaxID=2929795 RepID=UPI0020685850|nr:alpha/beta-hydrolase family protein [Tsukamurella sp. PLM1]BDH57258.1 membrane protein [Tsukamurella sp. PLM1]
MSDRTSSDAAARKGFATVVRHRLQRFSPVGLVLVIVFFGWSMTPSLLPRPWYLQSVATGLSVVAGYGIGAVVQALARAAGIRPRWSGRLRRIGWCVLAAAAVVTVPVLTVIGHDWQQIVRDMMGIERDPGPMYAAVVALALVVALVVLHIGRGIRVLGRWMRNALLRVVPRPIAAAGSLVLVAVLLVLTVQGIVDRGVIGAAQGTAELTDKSTPDGVEQPTAPERSGSAASHEPWDSLGREGRTFVAGGPSADRISQVIATPAKTPIRVYAGRVSADSVDGVAARVVAELERTHAFERKVLAVVTTTGRGWINPNVATSFEFVNGGDTAIAAMQYSFLPSALSFVADRQPPLDAGKALFSAVRARWEQLPAGSRPKLVVFGESLGSYGGQGAFSDAADMLAQVDGALMVGTPNFAEPWRGLTQSRDPGSYERLPVVDAGRNIRFASRVQDLHDPNTEWRFPRIVYWQHASDPITWWNWQLLYQRPDWLREPLGPDVDPKMRWLPVVSFWQITLDMVFSAEVPDGFGHSFGPDAVWLWRDILDSRLPHATVQRIEDAMNGRLP